MGDIQEDIENKAEELKDSSDDRHLGDAMDDADLEPEDTGPAPTTDYGALEAVEQGGPTQAGGPERDDTPEIKDDGGA